MSFPRQSLEALWSPWRVQYYEERDNSSPDFLLEAAQSTDDDAHFIVARNTSCFLIMNRYPYNVGHLMSVPNRKVSDLPELTGSETSDMWNLAVLAEDLLRRVLKAQGFNIGLNIGKAGGAGVADHLHLHIVPRWEGDANFMPVLGQTRILPGALRPLYERLREAAGTK